MNERDEARLEDMLFAARKAQVFASGKTREMLDNDDLLAFAVEDSAGRLKRRR